MNTAFWEALLAGLGFKKEDRKKDPAPKKTDKPA